MDSLFSGLNLGSVLNSDVVKSFIDNNKDGKVDINDLTSLINKNSAIGKNFSAGDILAAIRGAKGGLGSVGDVNGDGKIDINDLKAIMGKK